MSDKSKIEWTQATWTPIRARRKDDGKVGVHCERVSQGCTHCYSATFNKRRLPNQGTGLDFTVPNRDLVDIFLDEKILTSPLRWKRARKIFVCSQTDLFADFVPDEMIWEVFGIMALAEKHTFQVLTKRPERMRRLLNDGDGEFFWAMVEGCAQRRYQEMTREDPSMWLAVHGPLHNVWLGVSVEDQKNAKRVDVLRETEAATRFISYEPALSHVEFDLRGISLVIVGGESGHGARPFNVQWAFDVIDLCRAADVACFIKQLGANPCEDLFMDGDRVLAYKLVLLKDRKGGDMSEWREDLRVREMPS